MQASIWRTFRPQRRCLFVVLAVIGLQSCASAQTVVRSRGALWTIENDRIKVEVLAGSGRISVLEKESGYTWKQLGAERGAGAATLLIPQAAGAVRIDGDLADWQKTPLVRLTHKMTAHAVKVDGDRDCSAAVRCSWSEAALYIGVNVADDDLRFGDAGLEQWWQADSVEFWIGGTQVGLALSPDAPKAWVSGRYVEKCAVAVRKTADGYSVEAALPWHLVHRAPARKPGAAFRFAVGINDADATGQREGQLYFPTSWVHSSPASFAQAQLADKGGRAPALEVEAKFRDVRALEAPHRGLCFRSQFGATEGKPNVLDVSLLVPDGRAELIVECRTPDLKSKIHDFQFLAPFVLDTPDAVLAIADYCNGHVYPVDLKPFPRGTYFDAARLDMPWVGLCDLKRGIGCAVIIDTSDNAAVQCRHYDVGGRSLVAPQIIWKSSKGRLGHARRLVFGFVSKGGYVSLAKSYREYAKGRGLIVTLAEKARENPNVARLFGAADVWGDATLAFARSAKAAGVEKMLIHGRSSPEEMKGVNDLGYLTSEYDNYTDILPLEEGRGVDSQHDVLPDHAVLMSNGKRMSAWLTWDKKTRYMKRCPTFWKPTAQVVIPDVLRVRPFLGRFIDVTTAEGLYECFDPKHPLTKGRKRQCGVDLLSYVRSLGLVVGGEHGIWWAVPCQDYIEGMMSSYQFSWPAGHLIRPKSKDEMFTNPWGHKLGGWQAYEKLGIGHEWRVPLWELVFHDCIVSTWYWGDASDWLLQAAPEVTPRKDAFNVLYGTIPLLWANAAGSWHTHRDVFLRTYRNTCKLHEAIAGAEMVSHEFLSEDRALQRTRFSDGTEAVVNFGQDARPVTLAGRKHLLPQNGFAVKGPRIEQYLEITDGKPVTTIRRADYFYTDAGGNGLTMTAAGKDHVRAIVESGGHSVRMKPGELIESWDSVSTAVYAVDARGARTGPVEFRTEREGVFRVGPFNERTALDVICRGACGQPDLALAPGSLKVERDRIPQGEKLGVRAGIRNCGFAPADGVEVSFFVDAVSKRNLLATVSSSLRPGQIRTVTAQLETALMDGRRSVIAVVDPGGLVGELCERNNSSSVDIEVAPDLSKWSHRRSMRVIAGEVDLRDEPVVVPVNLPDVDTDSVRVVCCDGGGRYVSSCAVQFDVGDGAEGELCFALPGGTPAKSTRRLMLLWNEGKDDDRPRLLPPRDDIWNADERRITARTYTAEFSGGALRSIAPAIGGGYGTPFLEKLVVSSKETGWTEEPGTVERFDVLHSGPVRTTIFVRKSLNAGVVYEKTYRFYPRRFELTVSLNKAAPAIYSRGFYLGEGHYTDDKGLSAVVDGKGEAENIYARNKKPKWYAVRGDGWAHSCIALSDFDHLAYWDSAARGGIGLVTNEFKNVRMSYVFHGGAGDERFAERDYRRLTSQPRVEFD